MSTWVEDRPYEEGNHGGIAPTTAITVQYARSTVFMFFGSQLHEDVHQYGHHDLLPLLSDQRGGAVEIEECMAGLPASQATIQDLDGRVGQDLALHEASAGRR